MHESCHTHAWVMSHTWMSHVTHMNESCHTHEWAMSHTWMSHVKHMNESYHTHEWVMSHTWMSHVTRMNASCRALTHSCVWQLRIQTHISRLTLHIQMWPQHTSHHACWVMSHVTRMWDMTWVMSHVCEIWHESCHTYVRYELSTHHIMHAHAHVSRLISHIQMWCETSHIEHPPKNGVIYFSHCGQTRV